MKLSNRTIFISLIVGLFVVGLIIFTYIITPKQQKVTRLTSNIPINQPILLNNNSYRFINSQGSLIDMDQSGTTTYLGEVNTSYLPSISTEGSYVSLTNPSTNTIQLSASDSVMAASGIKKVIPKGYNFIWLSDKKYVYVLPEKFIPVGVEGKIQNKLGKIILGDLSTNTEKVVTSTTIADFFASTEESIQYYSFDNAAQITIKKYSTKSNREEIITQTTLNQINNNTLGSFIKTGDNKPLSVLRNTGEYISTTQFLQPSTTTFQSGDNLLGIDFGINTNSFILYSLTNSKPTKTISINQIIHNPQMIFTNQQNIFVVTTDGIYKVEGAL